MGTDKARLNEAGRTIWDYSLIAAITIDRPVKDVWPYFFEDKKGIWAKVAYLAVAGESEKVGEIYSMISAGHEATWFFETIRLKKEKQLVLKLTYQKYGDAEKTLLGYDFYEFRETAGRTVMAFQQVFAMAVDVDREKLDELTQNADRHHAETFRNLKGLVESQCLD